MWDYCKVEEILLYIIRYRQYVFCFLHVWFPSISTLYPIFTEMLINTLQGRAFTKREFNQRFKVITLDMSEYAV